MNRTIRSILAVGLAAVTMNAAAAPMQSADVPANPLWYIHVDCDALRQTYLGKYILYQLDKPQMSGNMKAFQSVFDFDVRSQLHGLTFFNCGPAPANSVGIIYADFEPNHLIQVVKSNSSIETIATNGHVIYSWQEGGDNARKYAEIQAHRVLSTKSKKSMLATLAVMDGRAPHLTASNLPAKWTNGITFLRAAGRDVGSFASGPTAAMLESCKQVKLEASEFQDQIRAVLTMDAGDDGAAMEVYIAARGILALFSLQKDNPQVVKLAKDISIKQNGPIVTATLFAPSSDVIAAVKAATEKPTSPKTAAK